ncbi:MAG: haloalkane dehalogenase, partial [Pseudomonadota bacterium]
AMGLGRCIAPDLIGMGHSDKIADPGPVTYSFDEHYRYLSAFLEHMGVTSNVTLVLHDWGSGLGFHWANQHRDAVKAIAYMEGFVRPFADWSDWDEGAASLFQGFRSEAGENLILERNMFIERVLPGSILRPLEESEMNEYRRPFERSEDRWPTLSWPRSIPVGGEPSGVHAKMEAYSQWLAQSDVPKLLINAEPGAILRGETLEYAREFPNQSEVTVKGSHFIQEDSGDEIGEHIAAWLGSL